jgi:Rrf2 family protein
MEITRETDYAIRCVLYLSGKEETIIMVDEVSRAMCIPKSFLAKILQKLTKAGVVTSFRGVKGGFRLAKKPKQINLLDIIEAIEGPAAMNRCALNASVCNFSATCTVHPVWVKLRKMVEDYLRKTDFRTLTSSASLKRKKTVYNEKKDSLGVHTNSYP